MKRLKYPRTVYFDINLKKWVSFYVNDKGETKIDKKADKQKDIFKEGYRKGHTKNLNKEQIEEYSYFIENKKERGFDHLHDFVKDELKLKRILNKKLPTQDDLINYNNLTPSQKRKIINKNDLDFLDYILKNPYFENKQLEVKRKLKIKKKGKRKGQHIIRQVMIVKYSSTKIYIPSKELKRLQNILINFRKVQIIFYINNEEFFTPFFKPTPRFNYEKLFTKIVSNYPSKINWHIENLHIDVIEG